MKVTKNQMESLGFSKVEPDLHLDEGVYKKTLHDGTAFIFLLLSDGITIRRIKDPMAKMLVVDSRDKASDFSFEEMKKYISDNCDEEIASDILVPQGSLSATVIIES